MQVFAREEPSPKGTWPLRIEKVNTSRVTDRDREICTFLVAYSDEAT